MLDCFIKKLDIKLMQMEWIIFILVMKY